MNRLKLNKVVFYRGLTNIYCYFRDTRLLILFFVHIAFLPSAYGQRIVAGPVVGAVTAHSAKMVMLTDGAVSAVLELYKMPDSTLTGIPFRSEKNIIQLNAENLEASCEYRYHISNEKISGSFKTFPGETGQKKFTMTFGSCSENYRDDSVFLEMQKHKPDIFLHLGDWTYPAHASYPEKPTANTHRIFVSDEKEIFTSYKVRYTMPNLSTLLSGTPVDYIFDDEDGIRDDFSKHTYCELQLNGGQTAIGEIPYADSLREKLLASYQHYFPSYTNPQHPGKAYHSFIYGNTEVFFIDTRSTRSPNTEVFYQNKKGIWKYKASTEHQILDSAQMAWLLNGLKNSKADWKIIASGTSFNADYKKILDICLLKPVQNRVLPNKMSGIYVAAAMSAMWFSYPASQGKLISFCRENKIKNVFICSGDAHTSAIDDGKHAGFPEIMSANLAQENTRFASIVENNLRLKLWNQGGQGLHNNNYNDAFGKVEVFGKDSVRLSAIDKYGTEICSYMLKDGFIPRRYNLRKHSKITAGNKLRAFKNLLKIGVHRKSYKG